jgi:hypothetical protein
MLEGTVLIWERALAYLTGRRNLTGCALALLGAGLAIADPVGPAGMVVVVGFYLVGAAAAQPKAAVSRYGFEPRDVLKRLQAEIAAVSGRVPPDVIIRIQRIELILRSEILPRLEVLPPGSLELYLVERTAADYLPTAVERYLRLPPSYSSARSQGVSASAYDVLLDELSLLEGGMRRVAEVVHRSDMDRLLAHHRFLNDRFGRLDSSA